MNESSERVETNNTITKRKKRKVVSKGEQVDGSDKPADAKQKSPSRKLSPDPEEDHQSTNKPCQHETKEGKSDGNDVTVKDQKNGVCDKCHYCADHFPHIKKKKKFACSRCRVNGIEKFFNSPLKLATHINAVHPAPDSKILFLCHECEGTPVAFKSKTKFMYHLGSKHPGIIYFVCEICAAAFKMKANYREHMSTHNVVSPKPYSCEVCKATFVNRAGYESHQRRFPGPHMKHVCPHCKFSFSKESHIRNHRCKKLLLEEGAARAALAFEVTPTIIESAIDLTDEPSSTEAQVYQSIPVTVSEPVVIEGIEDEDQEPLLLRELGGQVLPSGQVLQFDITETIEQPQQVYQVDVADWNMVAPFVIRDPSVQVQRSVE